MSTDRLTRVNELLKREIGTALFKIMADGEIDLSTVTITAVRASTNLRSAKVMVSIRDTEEKKHAVIAALMRHRSELQRLINENMNLKYTPRLTFEIDISVEKGDHVLQVLFELDKDSPKDSEDITDGGEES
jgi:ribosome-binding factor A